MIQSEVSGTVSECRKICAHCKNPVFIQKLPRMPEGKSGSGKSVNQQYFGTVIHVFLPTVSVMNFYPVDLFETAVCERSVRTDALEQGFVFGNLIGGTAVCKDQDS